MYTIDKSKDGQGKVYYHFSGAIGHITYTRMGNYQTPEAADEGAREVFEGYRPPATLDLEE